MRSLAPPAAWALLLLAASAGRAEELRQSVPVRAGGTLEIQLRMGSVEVRTHAQDEVSIEARAEGFGSGSIHFELTSEGADARLVSESSALLWLGGPRVRVRALVPENYSVDVRTGGGSIEIEELGGSARAHTSGGAIEIDGARGPVELHTSGGSVRVEDVHGDVSLETSGGSIRIADVEGHVDAETSGGSIRVDDARGPVNARTSGGSISVTFAGRPGGVIETSGGSIEAEWPEEFGVDLDARTSGGRVYVDPAIELRGSIDPGHAVGRIRGGGAELRLRTSGGNVRVRSR